MQIYEKAIENYAKHLREQLENNLKHEVAVYVKQAEEMTATGRCGLSMNCCNCPVALAWKQYPELDSRCLPDNVKEAITLEYKEEKQ